jgi:hypothetical protein
MGRKWRYVLWVYVAGALLTAAVMIQNAHANGGFQRKHSVFDLLVLTALYAATSILWPVLVVVVILQYFGILPHPIGR